MNNSDKFFENRECKYFPCHKHDGDFNCLFCFCPLYDLKNCPGDNMIIEKDDKKIKSCINCNYPHKPENYDTIMQLLRYKNEQ